MVSTPEIRSTQASILSGDLTSNEIRSTQASILSGDLSSTEIRSTQASILASINFPTEEMRVTQAQTLASTDSANMINITQTQVLVAYRGEIDNRRVRAWGFSQDGHDFYVLNLGQRETLIYDATTRQWASWNGASLPYWRGTIGWTWEGMDKASFDGNAASNIVVGDSSFGLLWTLDTTSQVDEAVEVTSPMNQITRTVRGLLPLRGRDKRRNNAVYLTVSPGSPATETSTVRLRTSDDQGNTWTDHGVITITANDFEQEILWRSLGIMRAPGRIFEFEDEGGVIRIDGADVRVGGDDSGN